MAKNLKLDCKTLSRLCEQILDGEPCFLIRAQDKLSIKALEHYAELSFDAHGGNVTTTRAVRDRFLNWQEEHADQVKVPD